MSRSRRSRRWLTEQEFLEHLALIDMERHEARATERRDIMQNARLGVASRDELAQLLPTSQIGRID